MVRALIYQSPQLVEQVSMEEALNEINVLALRIIDGTSHDYDEERFTTLHSHIFARLSLEDWYLRLHSKFGMGANASAAVYHTYRLADLVLPLQKILRLSKATNILQRAVERDLLLRLIALFSSSFIESPLFLSDGSSDSKVSMMVLIWQATFLCTTLQAGEKIANHYLLIGHQPLVFGRLPFDRNFRSKCIAGWEAWKFAGPTTTLLQECITKLLTQLLELVEVTLEEAPQGTDAMLQEEQADSDDQLKEALDFRELDRILSAAHIQAPGQGEAAVNLNLPALPSQVIFRASKLDQLKMQSVATLLESAHRITITTSRSANTSPNSAVVDMPNILRKVASPRTPRASRFGGNTPPATPVCPAKRKAESLAIDGFVARHHKRKHLYAHIIKLHGLHGTQSNTLKDHTRDTLRNHIRAKVRQWDKRGIPRKKGYRRIAA